MADIKQAAKWAEEGKRVRRPEMESTEWFALKLGCYFEWGSSEERNTEGSLLEISDILADDWEIAP